MSGNYNNNTETCDHHLNMLTVYGKLLISNVLLSIDSLQRGLRESEQEKQKTYDDIVKECKKYEKIIERALDARAIYNLEEIDDKFS